MSDEQNGWNEWSKHVLNELKRLNDGQDTIRQEIYIIRGGMTKVSVIENQIGEIRDWKRDVSNVCSPHQLEELVKKVDELQAFKIRAITLFAIVQIAFGLVLAFVK